ncbi:ALQxL family class IV lanthipeptide [Streptacidiphilus albus]|nr:ALQxL family class IV lanthipeptide [Streptacidiphilus albus]
MELDLDALQELPAEHESAQGCVATCTRSCGGSCQSTCLDTGDM